MGTDRSSANTQGNTSETITKGDEEGVGTNGKEHHLCVRTSGRSVTFTSYASR